MAKKVSVSLFYFLYLSVMLLPIFVLFFFPKENVQIEPSLFLEAVLNTGLLVFGVLVLSTILGCFFAIVHCFFNYPFKKMIHVLFILPLAFPSYVLAFIYLGMIGPSTGFDWFEIQGELWFLAITLTLSLTPYVYFFSCLGLKFITQSELETEKVMSAGAVSFFKLNVLPKILPFILSAQVLLCFETLADFGAASVINVPVMTTMIYKTWFDLFSFSGAVTLSLKYSLVILLVLLIELFVKRNQRGSSGLNREPVVGESLKKGLLYPFLLLASLYTFVSFILPFSQIIFWSIEGFQFSRLEETFFAVQKTLFLGVTASLSTVFIEILVNLTLRSFKLKKTIWALATTVGYSLPGTILAVSTYAILLLITGDLSPGVLLFALVVSLSYKFLTVSFRPISESVSNIPKELDEVSEVLNISYRKRFFSYILPYTKESLFVGFLLVMIEVMKEMPLTLMLAPSGYQTLSIKIFNYTSEGEWLKASLPSLVLVLVGVFAVLLVHLREKRV